MQPAAIASCFWYELVHTSCPNCLAAEVVMLVGTMTVWWIMVMLMVMLVGTVTA